jgi:hypothetical protein
MTTGKTVFGARWPAPLVLLSVFSTAILLGVAALFVVVFPRWVLNGWPFTLALGAIMAAFLGSLLFSIRGYAFEPSALLVNRLLWATRIPLDGLRAAWADPAAMKGSIRLFGNGGLFVFAGLFYNRTLGRYRVFATDPRSSVVLRFDARTVVVTPDDPRAFLAMLALYCPQADVRVR